MNVFETIYRVSLIGTFIVLILYTIETYKIRKINADQKDLQLLPAMMIYWQQSSGTERPILKNIGFGAALAIEILGTNVIEGKSKHDFTYHLVDGNNTLNPQEERGIGVNLTINGKYDSKPLPKFQQYYNPANLQVVQDYIESAGATGTLVGLETKRDISIRFGDISGKRYETTIHFGGKGVSIIKVPTRL